MIHHTNTKNPIDFPKLSVIDKLWGQALDQAVPDTYSSLTWTQVEKVKTVFAELIVKECADVIAPMGDWCGGHGEPSMPSTMECAKRLKEHFGVEE